MSARHRFTSIALAALLTVACGGQQSASLDADAADVSATASTAGPMSTAQGSSAGSSTAQASASALPGRTGELVNPDDATMIFLYYDLAGIAPPLDQWVEQDDRVTFARPSDKAALRKTIKAELESAAAAVRGIGFVRLTMNANLSDYDPTYGEFAVRALAPSSMVEFSAFRQKVSVRFSNGRIAQIWRVPYDEAQVIRDKAGQYGSHVTLDALLRIASVQPGVAGGTISAEVLEYEMRENLRGLPIGRVQVAQQ